jgi:pimeloyl-ACP methyl ester carboxylesterase
MRLSRLLWPFPFGVRLGWFSASVSNPDWGRACGRIFLLRGNGVIFSRGFGSICGELRRRGFWAEDLRCVGDRWLCRFLRGEQNTGRLHGPIIFVGHSCGGRYALYAAEELRQAGILVDLILCLDVALPPPVPSNVKVAINLYLTRFRLYPARPLVAAPDSSSHIMNIDLNSADSPVCPDGLHHLNFTDSAAVQSFVLEKIQETATRW